MAFSEIKPGQRDWLKVLNDSLKNNKWEKLTNAGTMINGCTGWVLGTIGYDEDMYVACVTGWVTIPNDTVSDFSTNPFDAVLDAKALPVIGSAFMGQHNGQNNFSPVRFNEAGNLQVRASSGAQWDKASYTGWISMTFAGPRGQLKV